jgi:ketosteroid isomerase-like protein
MKLPLFLIAITASLHSFAQQPSRSIVDAEKSFAAWSVKNGTRAAFLAFIDSNAILFNKDSFTNGRTLWEARENRPGILDWKPVVSEMSNGGDWGFTTGPWTFTKKEGDTVAARGHFFTIWKKEPGGEWKFIFDCGAEGGTEPLSELYTFQSPKRPGTMAALMMAEREFAARMLTSPVAAHQQFLSVTSVLVRNGQPVAITPGQQSKWFRGLPAAIEGAPAGHLLSPAGDMALVYGTIRSSGRQEPYLRLWRNEPGGWRLAAELLRL